MTYEAYEESTYAGSPVELYKFDREGISFWTYTSADTNQTYGGQIYVATALSRDDIEQSQETARAALRINMPSDTDFIGQFLGTSPTDVINLTLYRFHEGDGNVITTWNGRVISVSLNGYEAEVFCESTYTALQRLIARRYYQISCPHALYGTQCGVTKSSFAVTANNITISGLNVSSADLSGYDSGYFNGGTVEFTTGGLTTERRVVTYVGNTITINLPLTGAANGDTITVYPGCKHNTHDCNTVFSNILNYGGQPFIPDINPFDTVVF